MKIGWLFVVFGVVLMSFGIYLFGTYVLAIENWRAMLSSIAGLALLAMGVRSIRGTRISRATLVAVGIFLCLLGGYVLFRGEWRVSEVPESMLLLLAGAVLVVIGVRNAPVRE